MAEIYNRTAASDYAQKFALKYNASWGVGGADCTNFVSQALYAGGWGMIPGLPFDSRAWFSGDADSMCGGTCLLARTWAGAEPFAQFLRISHRAQACERNDLELGDIVQLVDGEGQAAHSMIVTKIDGDPPERYLSYHTKDRLNNPLSKVASSTYEGLRYWKIRDHIPEIPNITMVRTRWR